MTASDQLGAGGSLSALLASYPQRPLDQGGVGHVEIYRGQRYELLRREPYTRKRDGIEIELAVWRSRCLDCDAEFETTTVAHAHEFKPGARRCPAHRTSRQPAWRDRVVETDPAVVAQPMPDG